MSETRKKTAQEEKETKTKGKTEEKRFRLVTVERYQDLVLGKTMELGEEQEADAERSMLLLDAGVVKLKK
nr:MAG TPA: hypothetical protein [Caudoviricetes sp.]